VGCESLIPVFVRDFSRSKVQRDWKFGVLKPLEPEVPEASELAPTYSPQSYGILVETKGLGPEIDFKGKKGLTKSVCGSSI
jgi:hypothetical protein